MLLWQYKALILLDPTYTLPDLFSLFTWGNSIRGQLGNSISSFGTVSTPVTTFTGGTNWRQVSARRCPNGAPAAAIKSDGTLWTWGYGRFGLLGNANTSNTLTPVTTFVGGSNWEDLSCGITFMMVTTKN